MELVDYLAAFRKHLVVTIALPVIGVAAALLYSLLATPVYVTQVSVYLTVTETESVGELNRGSTYAENQALSFAELAKKPVVLDPVIDELDLHQDWRPLAEQMMVTVPPDTSVIEIAVRGESPEDLSLLANTIGSQLIDVIFDMSPISDSGDRSVEARVVAPAPVPASPSSPNILLNSGLGLLAGLLLGTGQALVRARLENKVVSQRDLQGVTPAPVLGEISYRREVENQPLNVQRDPYSGQAEDYRRLRTNLQFRQTGQRSQSLVVTSSIAGEGKSTAAVNIALSLAEVGMSVLLIDADFRRPSIARYTGIRTRIGLSNVIAGKKGLKDALRSIGKEGPTVLPAGPAPSNPSELLSGEKMLNLLRDAEKQYDLVIVDAPPLLPVTDAAVLSGMTDGALVVVGSHVVRRSDLVSALDSIKGAGGSVIGLVLTKVRHSPSGYRNRTYERRIK